MTNISPGRTARIGNKGLATSFYNDRNEDIAEQLTFYLQESHQDVPAFLEQYKAEEGAELKFDADSGSEDEAGSDDSSEADSDDSSEAGSDDGEGAAATSEKAKSEAGDAGGDAWGGAVEVEAPAAVEADW